MPLVVIAALAACSSTVPETETATGREPQPGAPEGPAGPGAAGAADVTAAGAAFEPRSGPAGTYVRISGTAFGATAEASVLSFRGGRVTPLSWSDTQITALVPPLLSGGSQPVSIVVNGVTRALGSFTVLPTIATVTPDAGSAGTLVTLAGANLGTTQGRSTVTFGGIPASVQSWSMTRIVAYVPYGTAGSSEIEVRVSGQVSNHPKFEVGGVVPKTVVSFSFDDSFSQQLDAAVVLRSHGMRGTFFVNAPRIDETNSVALFTRDELRALQTDGHEIGGHTLNHLPLTRLANDELLRQICNDRTQLLGLGLDVTSFAYPYGMYDDATKLAAAQCGYNSARITDHRDHAWPQAFSPPDLYSVAAAPSIMTKTTLAAMQGYVTSVEAAGGGWVPLVIHRMCTTCGPEETTNAQTLSVSTLDAFAAWLESRAAQGTVVRTFQQVLQGAMKPAVVAPAAAVRPATGELVQNPSMELDDEGGGYPSCWSPGGNSEREPEWTRTSDAHTGAWAMLLQEPTPTSTQRRLGVTQDSGACSIAAVPGERFTVSAFYKSSGPVAFLFHRRDGRGFWRSWASSPQRPASASWSQASFTTGALPDDTTAVSAAIYLVDPGTMTVDDFSVTRAVSP